ncbi:MAG: accessory gene regulator B family protein [Epulopiscium sp.]|nr:accessory gene regulator B family protein [Candidatus Epulonipiscium sp.]
MERLIQKIIKTYKKHDQIDQSQEAILEYGIYLIFSTILGAICTLGVSILLGIFSIVAMILLTMSILRYVSGGAHFIKMGHCIFMTVVITNTMGLVVQYIPISFGGIFTLSLFCFIFALRNILRYAPADTPQKPIDNKHHRKKLRQQSLVLICIWFIGVILSFVNDWKTTSKVLLATTLAIAWQCFTLTPKGYQFYAQIDTFFEKIKGKKQKKEAL